MTAFNLITSFQNTETEKTQVSDFQPVIWCYWELLTHGSHRYVTFGSFGALSFCRNNALIENDKHDSIA